MYAYQPPIPECLPLALQTLRQPPTSLKHPAQKISGENDEKDTRVKSQHYRGWWGVTI